MYNLKYKIKSIVLAGILLLGCTLIPKLALAANVYLDADYPSIAVGDTVIVNLVIDALDKNPNVVEGDILITKGEKNIKISELSLSGSVLSYWPKSPSLDSKTTISFLGGVPGGFKQNHGLLFKIVFSAEKEGEVVFSPTNIKAYDNDGKATLIDVVNKPFTVKIGPKVAEQKNQWLEIISNDNAPPQELTAVVGQDESVFEGKKFLAVSAVDTQSGIDYYEVAEGDWPSVRSGETYVLQDQSESSVITVTAYDKAGNHDKILLEPKVAPTAISYWKSIIFAALFIALFYGAFRTFKALKKKNAHI